MVTYKVIDFWGQVLSILGSIFGYWLDASGAVLSISLIALVVFQLVSLVVHASAGPQTWKSPLRRWHVLATIAVLLVMIYGLFKPAEDKYDYSGLGIIVQALVPAIVVALFYTIICGMEWQTLRRSRQS